MSVEQTLIYDQFETILLYILQNIYVAKNFVNDDDNIVFKKTNTASEEILKCFRKTLN